MKLLPLTQRCIFRPARGNASNVRIEMASIDEVGERDQWLCWICDKKVDPDLSVNDDLGPSLDRCDALTKTYGKKKPVGEERLAHRQCNTKKGAVKPVIAWSNDLLLFDPAPILQSAERLMNKGGREIVARCGSQSDASDAGVWLLDRLGRLVPAVTFTTKIEQGGGQFLLSLMAAK
jgi:hypothetical protein